MESVGAPALDAVEFIDATRLATALMGDSIAAKLLMLGYARQKGRIPLSEAALLRAIELNGVGIESNKRSFLWGRRAAVDLKCVERVATPSQAIVVQTPVSLENVIDRRVAFLSAYQHSAYAGQYAQLVARVRKAESAQGLGNKLSTAVAKYYFKLMAYKDEYEVALVYGQTFCPAVAVAV